MNQSSLIFNLSSGQSSFLTLGSLVLINSTIVVSVNSSTITSPTTFILILGNVTTKPTFQVIDTSTNPCVVLTDTTSESEEGISITFDSTNICTSGKFTNVIIGCVVGIVLVAVMLGAILLFGRKRKMEIEKAGIKKALS